jgi:CBS domain-containing protein
MAQPEGAQSVFGGETTCQGLPRAVVRPMQQPSVAGSASEEKLMAVVDDALDASRKPGSPEPMARQCVAARMRRAFISAAADDDLLQVSQIMQLARIRHLPVLAGEFLAGIVSHRDVLEALSSPLEGAPDALRRELLRGTPVSRVMRTPVHTVAADATLQEAAQQMLRYKIGCLPVVADCAGGARALGLITESDLIAAAYLPGLDPRTLEPLAPEPPLPAGARRG